MKKILVTGASGFIGRQLVPRMVAEGYQVRAVSRQPTRFAGAECRILRAWGNLVSWEGIMEGVDQVIHLAGMAHFRRHLLLGEGISPRRKRLFAQELLEANTVNTGTLAKEARQAGIKKILYLSSIGAVASASDEAIKPETPPHPDTPYGQSKLAAERELVSLLRGTDTEVAILRPPLVYGPGNIANMSRLIRWVQSGWPIPIGLVKNRRSLIYVGNLISLILRMVEHAGVPDQPIMVSDGKDISTAELVRQIARALGRQCRLWPVPPKILQLFDGFFSTDVFQKLCGSLYLDMSQTTGFFRWQPPYTLEQGLQATVRGLTLQTSDDSE